MLGRPDHLPVEWVIEDTVCNWWRPNFETAQVRIDEYFFVWTPLMIYNSIKLFIARTWLAGGPNLRCGQLLGGKMVRFGSKRNTHSRLMALCSRLPGSASTRKAKPIWILLKQETVSGSGISWDICKSAPHSWLITMPASHHSVFYRPEALPATQPTESKH